jgi:putative tricarboxylic transport membrane protein
VIAGGAVAIGPEAGRTVVSVLARSWLPGVLFLAAAALFVIAGGIEAPGLQAGQLAPSFWPRAMLAGLMLGCVAKVVEIVRRGEPVGPPAFSADADGPGGSTPDRRTVVGSIGAVLGYVLATDLIGFAFATFLFLLAFIYLGGWRAKLSLLVLAGAGTVTVLYVFVKIVYLPLPKGWEVFEDLTIALYRLLRLF